MDVSKENPGALLICIRSYRERVYYFGLICKQGVLSDEYVREKNGGRGYSNASA
jgi:hypothetical protein